MDQVKFVENSLKNLKWYGLPTQTISRQIFLKAVFHKLYSVHSWIPWPNCYAIYLQFVSWFSYLIIM